MKVLIVGSGIAGISVAERFLERGVDVHVIAEKNRPSSTRVATGMYNPVVFRRLNLSWMIEELLPELHAFYQGLEKKLGISLNEPIEFVKRIPSEDYAALWNSRQREQAHAEFLDPINEGFGPVKQVGMINCSLLQRSYEAYLSSQGRLIDRAFDHAEVQLENGEVVLPEGRYNLVVFCEGPYAVGNPYFNWLPFNLCQGEWIIIQTKEAITNRVINNKTNVIPLGDNHYKLSSTYDWNTLDWQPHDEARDQLLADFKEVFDVPFEVIDHQAGLRPTVADRRPYLGRHPEHAQLAIFNGLGSKGIMLAPYFSTHLIDHLLDDNPLMPEVDIMRHGKRLRTD